MRLFSTLSYAASLAVVWGAGSVGAEEGKPTAVSQKELRSKAAFCQTCHGITAQGGFRGNLLIPKLAGQQPEYIRNQLQAFIEHRRVSPVMGLIVRSLSPAMVVALSAYFKDLDPRPIESGPRDLAPEGQQIFEEGVSSAEVPPCSTCHGAEAQGAGEYPRLAGQIDDYINVQLKNWSKQRGLAPAQPDISSVMAPIAEKLTERQIAAVSAYLSYQK